MPRSTAPSIVASCSSRFSVSGTLAPMRCEGSANRVRIGANGSQLIEAMWSVERLTLTPAARSSPSWISPSCDARRASSWGEVGSLPPPALGVPQLLGGFQQRMDELHVGTQQAGPLQLGDRAGARRVHGDRQAE